MPTPTDEALIVTWLSGEPGARAQVRALLADAPRDVAPAMRLIVATDDVALANERVWDRAGHRYRRREKRRREADCERAIALAAAEVSWLTASAWEPLSAVTKWPSERLLLARRSDTRAGVCFDAYVSSDGCTLCSVRWLIAPVRPGGPLRVRMGGHWEIPF